MRTHTTAKNFNFTLKKEHIISQSFQQKQTFYPVKLEKERDQFSPMILTLTLKNDIYSAKDMVWLFIRYHLQSASGQKLPGWAGFISQTGLKPSRLTKTSIIIR